MTDDVKPSAAAGRSRIQVPAVLETVRARSLQHLSDLLKGMFDRLETILYDWARDLPEAEQSRYLDVMVGVRGKRADIETRFRNLVAAAYDRLLKGGSEGEEARKGLDAVDFSTLALVDAEEMDITVTMDAMVAKARLDFAAPLGLLRRRFSHVMPKVEILDRNLPLDPAQVLAAFKEAMQPLEVGVADKILILRVFQQQVLGGLGPLFDEANQLFVDAGVLPDLKVALASPAKAPAPRPEKRVAEEPLKPHGNTEEIFSFLQGVLQREGGGPGGGGPGGGGPGGGGTGPVIQGATYHGGHYVGGGGVGALPAAVIGGSVAAVPIAPEHIAPTAVVQTVATPELVALLSQIQQQQPKAPLAEDASTPSVGAVRGSIRDNLRSDQETVEAIKQADEDVINLVSMLFDFILDDDEDRKSVV